MPVAGGLAWPIVPRTRKLGIGSGLVLGLFLLVSPPVAGAAPDQGSGSPTTPGPAIKTVAIFERDRADDALAVRYLQVEPDTKTVTVRFFDDHVLERPTVTVSVYAGTPAGAATRIQLRKTGGGTETVSQTSTGGNTFTGDGTATGRIVDGSTATLDLPAG